MSSDLDRNCGVADRVSLDEIVYWMRSGTNYRVRLQFRLRGGETWRAMYQTLNGEELEVPVGAPAQTMVKEVHQRMMCIARLVAKMIFGQQVVPTFERRDIAKNIA